MTFFLANIGKQNKKIKLDNCLILNIKEIIDDMPGAIVFKTSPYFYANMEISNYG